MKKLKVGGWGTCRKRGAPGPPQAPSSRQQTERGLYLRLGGPIPHHPLPEEQVEGRVTVDAYGTKDQQSKRINMGSICFARTATPGTTCICILHSVFVFLQAKEGNAVVLKQWIHLCFYKIKRDNGPKSNNLIKFKAALHFYIFFPLIRKRIQ